MRVGAEPNLIWQADTRQPLLKRPTVRRWNRNRVEQVAVTALIVVFFLYIVSRLPQ